MILVSRLRRPQPSTRFALGLLLITRLAAGLLYSLSVPSWEAYDEDGHFAYARYIAVYHSLLKPDDPEAKKVWEKFQPPLYYVLTAPFIAGFDLGDTWQAPPSNPYFVAGNAGYNRRLHSPEPTYAEAQLDLAVRMARLFSVIISILGTGCVFLTARLLWPSGKNKVWTVTLLYAFWPQFLFNGSVVTNDALVTALAPAVIYLILRLFLRSFNWRDLLSVCALLGASILTKLNALALLPMAVVALGLSLARAKLKASTRWLAIGAAGLLLAAALGVISSLRLVTDHVFQLRTIVRFFNNLSHTSILLKAPLYSFRTFIGSFGWGNLETYSWLYPLGAALLASGVLGLIWGGLRRQFRAGTLPLALLALHALSVYGLTLALAVADDTSHLTHGRYLLPALPAVCFLLVSGWQALLPRRWQTNAWKIVSLGVVLVSWSIPFKTLAPAYAYPSPAPDARLEALQPVNAVWANAIELIGYERAQTVKPGEKLTLTLCWQAVQLVEKDYTFQLDIVGPDGQGYGGLTTYPGRGNYATSFWKVNEPFCDDYSITIGTGMPAPAMAKVLVRLWDQDLKQALPWTQPEAQPKGSQAVPVAVAFKVEATVDVEPSLEHSITYRFGEELILRGYELKPIGGARPGYSVVLHWEAARQMSVNYVVFVHLRDPSAQIYAQDDSEPRQTWYPTPWWKDGENVLDEHILRLPEGTAPPLDLYIGVYHPVTQMRLPVFDAQGNAVPNDEVRLIQNLTLP